MSWRERELPLPQWTSALWAWGMLWPRCLRRCTPPATAIIPTPTGCAFTNAHWSDAWLKPQCHVVTSQTHKRRRLHWLKVELRSENLSSEATLYLDMMDRPARPFFC